MTGRPSKSTRIQAGARSPCSTPCADIVARNAAAANIMAFTIVPNTRALMRSPDASRGAAQPFASPKRATEPRGDASDGTFPPGEPAGHRRLCRRPSWSGISPSRYVRSERVMACAAGAVILGYQFPGGRPVLSNDATRPGIEIRREIFGKEVTDRQIEQASRFLAPMQEVVSRYCFGETWSREGLTRRKRSMITLAALCAMGRTHELRIH